MPNPIEKMFDMTTRLYDTDTVEDTVFELYAYDATFEDPLIRRTTRKDILKMWKALPAQIHNVECSLTRQAVTDTHAIGEWVLRFNLRWWPRRLSLTGVTWLDLDHNGQIVRQVDYWDVWTLAASIAPLPSALRHLLPGPLKRLTPAHSRRSR